MYGQRHDLNRAVDRRSHILNPELSLIEAAFGIDANQRRIELIRIRVRDFLHRVVFRLDQQPREFGADPFQPGDVRQPGQFQQVFFPDLILFRKLTPGLAGNTLGKSCAVCLMPACCNLRTTAGLTPGNSFRSIGLGW